MALALPEMDALYSLTPDGRLLFATRVVRMAAYGALSVVLELYLNCIDWCIAQRTTF